MEIVKCDIVSSFYIYIGMICKNNNKLNILQLKSYCLIEV